MDTFTKLIVRANGTAFKANPAEDAFSDTIKGADRQPIIFSREYAMEYAAQKRLQAVFEGDAAPTYSRELSPMEAAQANVGGYFFLRNRRCHVLKVDSFSGIPHYGFTTCDSHGPDVVGWVPAALIGQTEL